jgi:amino acid adenylation domain-containing protein
MSLGDVLRDVESRGLSITAVGNDLRLQGPRELMDADLVGRIKSVKPALLAHLSSRPGVALTPLQRGYLVGRGDLMQMGNVASHVYHEITGRWDVGRLEHALQSIVDRHSLLRTRFTSDGLQVEQDTAVVRIRSRDLRALPRSAQEQCLLTVREKWSHQVLPADQAPLVAAEVTILADDRMIMHVSHDGLVMDGISMFLFFRAWWAAYSGVPDYEPELPFCDYVAAVEAARDKPAAQRARAYWLDRLDDLAPYPDLPLAARPSAIGQPRFTQRLVRMDAPAWAELKGRASGAGVTPTGVLLMAYAETLANWGAGCRFTINTTIANRPPIHPRIFDAIGQFSDTMLVEVSADRERDFGSRARALQAQLRRDIDQRHFSGVDVLREMARRGDATRAMAPYTFNAAIGCPGAVDGSALELFGREVFSVSQTPQVWLNAFAMEQHGGLLVQIDGVDELFPDGFLDDLAEGYQTLLGRLVAQAAWAEPAFDLRPAAQRQRRAAVNDTAVPIAGRLLPECVMAQAARQPAAPAVLTSQGALTYGELWRRASHAASWLREHQVARNELVGLVMRRGPEQVIGILATVLAGGAYLPVDAALPAERQAYLLRDGRVRCVLTNAPVPVAGCDGIAVLGLDADPSASLDRPAEVPTLSGASLDDLAYVLYTSGTTGEPKGVMVSQRSVVNVVADCNARFGVRDDDRFFGISAFNFDLSVYDVFGALTAGAAIVIPDRDRAADPSHWLDMCESAGVTVWNSVPAIVALLHDEAKADPRRLNTLRLIMMSGDRIPPTLPAMLLRVKPGLEVVSLGGPTETTVWNILHPITPADNGVRSIPYGRPNANNRAYILDAAGLDTPDWVPGDICAAGAGLARGYWGDDARTAERFWFDTRRGERLYRTGDLGRYLPDGEIEILGRSDFQIKVNGYRIEAEEVETRLAALDEVKQAVVVRQGAARGDRLAAHLTAAGDVRPSLNEIRDRLRSQLPEYMVPAAVQWHDTLPLTRNGKVDRGALAAMAPADQPGPGPAGAPGLSPAAPDGGPASQVERELAEIWAVILQLPDVNAEVSFYDLGGDSLAAARLLTEVRKHYRVTIPLDQLYEVRTVRAMAARVLAAIGDRLDGAA